MLVASKCISAKRGLGRSPFFRLHSTFVSRFRSVFEGARVLRVANVSATRQPAPLKIGIHIVSGFEYQPVAGFWLRGDMRFRDPELRTVNRFSEQSTEYNNVTVTFPRSDVASKINLDGLTFSVGIIVELL